MKRRRRPPGDEGAGANYGERDAGRQVKHPGATLLAGDVRQHVVRLEEGGPGQRSGEQSRPQRGQAWAAARRSVAQGR